MTLHHLNDLNIAAALIAGTRRLMGFSGSARLDAALILAYVIERPREYLIAHPEAAITTHQLRVYEMLITLRRRGMPVAYILGRRGFYDRTLRVTPHVLVPRPETEHVVEFALGWLRERFGPQGRGARVIDVGTGSGAIAVTLAANLPGAMVIASDVSARALEVAKLNGEGIPNLGYLQADLLSPIQIGAAHGFDCICANMPYIASDELDILEVAKFEPGVALDGGPDGLLLIRRLLAQIPGRITSPGLVLLEIGADQGAAVAELARAVFPNAPVNVLKDLGKLDRVVRIDL